MPSSGQDKAPSNPRQTGGRPPSRVRDIMREVVELLHPDHDLHEARRRMAASGDAMLPVVDGDEIVGVLTDNTLSRRFASSRDEPSEAGPAAEAHVRDDMRASIPICRPEETLVAAAAAIEREACPALLVINDADELVGIVGRTDFAAAGFLFPRPEVGEGARGAGVHAVKSAARARGEKPGILQSYSVKPRLRR